MATGWPEAAQDGHALSAEQSVELRQAFATYLIGTADAYRQIEYLGAVYVEDTQPETTGAEAAALPPPARRHLQAANAGTLLVRMSAVLPSSQVQQRAASLSLGYTSGELGNNMAASGLPRPTVLNTGEDAMGHDAAPGAAGLGAGAALSEGSVPPGEGAGSVAAGAVVMTVVSCCVCFAVVVAVLGHGMRARSSLRMWDFDDDGPHSTCDTTSVHATPLTSSPCGASFA
ncbi:hypothetical protein FOA52_004318 [Chlamydomonas sp. UWO 241]|nr:hypothetical protein FOA52_004318 [Chlamydomonas sp. UWO 241]